jgi:hypothetical protein
MSIDTIAQQAAALTTSLAAFPPVPAPHGAPVRLLRVIYIVTDVALGKDSATVTMEHNRDKDREYPSVPEYWETAVLPVISNASEDSGQKARALFQFDRALAQYYSKNGKQDFSELQERAYDRVQSLRKQVIALAPLQKPVLYVPSEINEQRMSRANHRNHVTMENWMFLNPEETQLLYDFTLTRACAEGMPYVRTVTELAGKGIRITTDAPPLR